MSDYSTDLTSHGCNKIKLIAETCKKGPGILSVRHVQPSSTITLQI